MAAPVTHREIAPGAALFIVCLCILFGGNGVAMKFAYTGVSPFACAAIRFSMAALVLFAWARFKKIPLALTRAQQKRIVFQCLLFTIQVSGFHLGLNHTTASHAALVANALPFMVLVLAHYFIPGDRITPKKGVGVLLGFAGVVILFFDDPDLAGSLHTGDFIVLGAVICWSVSGVYVKRIADQFNPVQLTWYPMLLGIPFFMLNSLIWDDTAITQITPQVGLALVYQGVVTASFGFVAWNTMLKQFGATALHSFIFIVPVAGVSFGVIFLSEPVTVNLLMAMACIVAGILTVNFGPPSRLPLMPPR